MVPLHDDLFDFFYQALPGYEQVGYRRTLIGCWGSFQDPDVCDYDYRTMDKWGRAMFVTPGVVVDRKLVTTSLVDKALTEIRAGRTKTWNEFTVPKEAIGCGFHEAVRGVLSHHMVIDFGIRGMELAYTLLDDYDALVLVDCVSRGGTPGTLYLIEPDLAGMVPENGAEAGRAALDAHSMDPAKVLAFASLLGARPIHTLIVGCEPAKIITGEDDTDMQMGLSEPVQLPSVRQ